MKLFLIILAVIAVALGVLAANDPGFVVLTRAPYEIRMPLILFVLLLFLFFMSLYLLLNFLSKVFSAPKKYRQWQKQVNQNSAGKHTMQGFAGLIEGNWSKAEVELLTKLEYNRMPLVNYLGAAYAAQQQGERIKRNEYLDDALEKFPDQHLAVNLTRARMLFQSGEFSEARDCLEQQRAKSSTNIPLHRLLVDVYQSLEDWNALILLMPKLRQLKAFGLSEIHHREAQAYQNMLRSNALLQGENKGYQQKWASLPTNIKKDPAALSIYVKHLMEAGEELQAEKLLRIALKREFDPNLMRLYGQVTIPKIEKQQITKQITFAESYRDQHGDNPEVLIALACLYRKHGQLDKSRELYLNAIDAGEPLRAMAGLATLFEKMGDSTSALVYYRRTLGLLNRQSSLEKSKANNNEMVVLEVSKDAPKDVSPDANPRDVIPTVKANN